MTLPASVLEYLAERIEHEAATLRGTDADVPDTAWPIELIRRDGERRSGSDRRITPREALERRKVHQSDTNN